MPNGKDAEELKPDTPRMQPIWEYRDGSEARRDLDKVLQHWRSHATSMDSLEFFISNILYDLCPGSIIPEVPLTSDNLDMVEDYITTYVATKLVERNYIYLTEVLDRREENNPQGLSGECSGEAGKSE